MFDPKGSGYYPLGMGVAVPAIHIVELLEGEPLASQREMKKRESARERGELLTPQVATRHVESKSENPHHKEDFTHLLDAAVKGKKPDDQT
jgi:hypothetical protein